jgi:CheY-like chemotaxis protein
LASRKHPPLEGVHVLIVDDDEDARYVLRAYLAHHGALVTVAADAAEALAALHRVHVDVIVSDLSMPWMDGHELLLRMRKLPEQIQRPTPAIALTAFDNPQHRRKAQEVGFEAYLAKPLDPELVVLAIARLVAPPAPRE